ncbi:MAG: aldehyde dehydrogenase family protein [Actinomycetota bacterium]|nr:aldehyde dehydrogenase family protein [Actinomycetota bacterium]
MPDPMFPPQSMLIDGDWLAAGEHGDGEVRSPYDGSLVARVPAGGERDVAAAVAAAKAALARDDFPRHERISVLERAAGALAERNEEFARAIAAESAKPIKTARLEAQRAVDTFAFAAAAARDLAGTVVPIEATEGGAGRTAFTLRVPVGIVGAIAPFNFPLNLVAHKVAPALAAGCPVVLKPASQTPVSSLLLARLLVELGVPRGWLNVVTGGGGAVGEPMVGSDDIAYLTFTGSSDVGWAMAGKAPKKKVRLELGSNSPLVVDVGGDWETAATKTATAGFAHAGQSCISTQRIFLHEDIAEDFLAVLLPAVEALTVGDPMKEDTDVSSLISEAERDRVLAWIEEAQEAGAKLLCGGELVDNCIRPAVLADVTRDMQVQSGEIFGPVVTVTRFRDFDEALAMANDSRYGLQAGVFTRDLGKALKAARTLVYGGVLINDVPTHREDQQPYGGVKDSGNTREGPAYAVEEMTELRMVSLQG